MLPGESWASLRWALDGHSVWNETKLPIGQIG